jgi:hypothetical protein
MGLLSRLFGRKSKLPPATSDGANASTEPAQATPVAPNEAEKSVSAPEERLEKQWQRRWREVLGESTDDMPDDVNSDYTLHFDIWSLDDDKLAACFARFPNGDKLLQRAKHVMTPRKPQDLTDEQLLTLLDEMNTKIETVLAQHTNEQSIQLNAEKAQCSGKKVYRGDEELRRQLLGAADSPTVHLDDELSRIIEVNAGATACEAYYFLVEPLYRLGGNYYSVVHWVAWAMVEEFFDVDPYQPGYELFMAKAQAGWSKDELFVFIAR